MELKLSRPNYTIETLNYLQKYFPEYKFSLIIGSDNFKKIHLWKESQKILKNFPIYVFPRKGYSANNKHIKLNSITFLSEMQPILISSTIIRSGINKKEISNQIMPSVIDYISKNNLYT